MAIRLSAEPRPTGLAAREIAAAAGTVRALLSAFHRIDRVPRPSEAGGHPASAFSCRRRFSGSVALTWKTRVVSPDARCGASGNGTRASRSVVKLPDLPSTARARCADFPGTAAPEVAPSDANFNCNTCARPK